MLHGRVITFQKKRKRNSAAQATCFLCLAVGIKLYTQLGTGVIRWCLTLTLTLISEMNTRATR